jgi:hypothetical protein
MLICAPIQDFLGRNDAPSGLTLDLSLIKGIKVLDHFKPSFEGAVKPGKTVKKINPVPGRQAAVTFGVGVTTQQLHNAVYSSKLMTIGAAHGETGEKKS